jgi:endonuclease-3
MTKQERVNIIISELHRLFPKTGIALAHSNHIELLIAVILSAQCTDKKVNQVTPKLFAKYPTLADYCAASLEEFEQDIKSIGLYRSKAKNILKTVKILRDEQDGEVPASFDALIALPGVGRKTANVVMGNAFGIASGIAVDTHVKRLATLFKLTKQSDPNKIEQDLIKIVPKEEWVDFTHRMILYGRAYCPAHCKHHDCPIYAKLFPNKITQ